MIETRLDQPPAALETLVQELQIGEPQTQLWEALHGAAVRDARESGVATAYRNLASGKRLQQLQPSAQAQVFMHAADFFQGMIGDGTAAENFLLRVMEIVPGQPDAFARLERRFEAQGDKQRLIELYSLAAAAPPNGADDLVKKALNALMPLPAKTAISAEACKRFVALVPTHPSILEALEAHCKKTQRPGLACALIEQAILEHNLGEARVVELRRRLIELYTGEAATPNNAISHVEALLDRDPGDAGARTGAERLLGSREVGSRAAAALQKARRQARSG